ncbi:hypothetical protein EMIHUDRAFT_109165 [Emiliania huxleyi CCMP1516]|uniref:SAM-dependent MTase RsmB/NOP-type domain-containing protein n=2 Tax=Emiliania huxleyi TaxID=2903 RepID=A0A0D3KKA8_EMIH1|nr:hypothetical protein EMIHUDRAFT_110431 [Emiliania huxleyi CCMP1516]XP_005791164.1 hypothetical protein EMIHUDRAFT_109165 [Emiliania huxleyi CCMP1516]EOD36193.1 hypothetical protein EMIHUDRAFT_110431 [Emiliania huxleyi CCMP1516]EOD38735.1 hypothetical protein EMIHUDRAFT_109165 [Emiliania huxleyi CCMP1516]|eukprot:XP_005788622.1 hypothetical protein EMIHUDRAFT_110431 [Emiliania huxleyi CCMP1516]
MLAVLPALAGLAVTAPTSSRGVAHRVLLRCARDGAFADRALSSAIEGAGGLSGGDRALATELVYGVLRHTRSLDHSLAQLATLNRTALPTAVALRIGAYELLHLSTPDHAAVDEAVSLIGAKAQRRFVNGVLRNLARGRGRLVSPDADPRLGARAALAVRTSTPEWLLDDVARALRGDEAAALEEEGGEAAAAEAEVVAWAEASQRAPRLALRVNEARCTADAALSALVGAGVDATLHPAAPGCLLVRGGGAPHRLPGFAEGHWTVQDAAAALIGALAAPAAGGAVVLELCAAPGGKTTHLASLLGEGGVVVAVELHSRKLRLIEESSARLGVAAAVRPVAADATDVPALRAALAAHAGGAQAADCVLVDAPCSGMGTLRRNPEHRAKGRAQLAALPALQGRLLDAASACVRVGGVVTYSVCTPRAEEGDDVLAAFLQRHAGRFELERIEAAALRPFAAPRERWGGDVLQTWTHRHELDSHYAARMRRVA